MLYRNILFSIQEPPYKRVKIQMWKDLDIWKNKFINLHNGTIKTLLCFLSNCRVFNSAMIHTDKLIIFKYQDFFRSISIPVFTGVLGLRKVNFNTLKFHFIFKSCYSSGWCLLWRRWATLSLLFMTVLSLKLYNRQLNWYQLSLGIFLGKIKLCLKKSIKNLP